MIWANKSNMNALPDLMLAADRIYLRPPKLSDWESWSDVRGRNQMRLKPFEPSWPPDCLSKDFFKRRLKRQERDWQNDRGKSFLVFKASDVSLIGGININNIQRGAAQYATLGYWIDKDHEGQGYMSEALQITLKYCFTHLNLHRVHASCILRNERSKKLLLNNGFVEEGQAKNYLKIDGHWQDHILFGCCIENFNMS